MEYFFDYKTIIALSAFIVSLLALYFSVRFARKNIRVSIQQAIFRIVSDKARDCNQVWKNEPENEMNDTSPHYLVMTELIISKEVIDKSFHLFAKNQKSIRKMKEDYFYLLYKQLTPSIRGYIKRSKSIAERINDKYFTEQSTDIVAILQIYFEPIK